MWGGDGGEAVEVLGRRLHVKLARGYRNCMITGRGPPDSEVKDGLSHDSKAR